MQSNWTRSKSGAYDPACIPSVRWKRCDPALAAGVSRCAAMLGSEAMRQGRSSCCTSCCPSTSGFPFARSPSSRPALASFRFGTSAWAVSPSSGSKVHQAGRLSVASQRMGPKVFSMIMPKMDMKTMYSLAAVKMNSWAWFALWRAEIWKKRSVTGTCPRAPWMVARGMIERKQKQLSWTTWHLWNGWPGKSKINDMLMPKKIPAKRKVKPTMMIGKTCSRN
mmetsp:Transcript_78491/g.230213  ORF Transcript_78491/g.230213 Transcript_78491/m.230213 type:complete len:222 (+) Transcript_78491:154-819(+)